MHIWLSGHHFENFKTRLWGRNLFSMIFAFSVSILCKIRVKILVFVIREISDFLKEQHKSTLVKIRLLWGYFFFTQKTLEPILTLFTDVPCLHIVNNSNVIEFPLVNCWWNTLIFMPELWVLWGWGPFYSYQQQWVVDKIEVFKKQCIFVQNLSNTCYFLPWDMYFTLSFYEISIF